MPIESGKAPTVAVIGLAWLIGSAVLAWLSSPATLMLIRDNEDHVAATLQSRLFGLFTTRSERIDGIQSVSVVSYNAPGHPSDTPDRLVFDTAKGPVDLGRNQQLFAQEHPKIAGFIKDGPQSLTLSSIDRGSERRRYVIAQVIALFLFLGGLGLEWMLLQNLRS
ncbi:MAG: hypothetical protein ABIT71_20040 [Vicinamibacteraceae bacterium]